MSLLSLLINSMLSCWKKIYFFTLNGRVVTILNMRVHFSCISLFAQSSTQMQKLHNVINSSHPPLLKFVHLHPENSTQGLNVATCITIPQKRLTAVAISSLSICISKGLMKQSPAKLLFFNADYLNTVISKKKVEVMFLKTISYKDVLLVCNSSCCSLHLLAEETHPAVWKWQTSIKQQFIFKYFLMQNDIIL